MRHLIVEACIARNLLDTSAYIWPGYVKGRSNQIPRSVSSQMPGWSSLLKGSPLTPALISALVTTPASRYAHLGMPFFSSRATRPCCSSCVVVLIETVLC